MAELNDKLPIYIRLIEGIKDAILQEELKEEEQIPSTTVLSKRYEINIATVNKAIGALVNEGLLYKKRGIGMFVSLGAKSRLVESRKKSFKDDFVKATLIEAKKLGISVEELQSIVAIAYDEMK